MTDKPDPDCPHDNFKAHVKVNHITDTGKYVADVTITCDRCNLPFQFLGLPPGISFKNPTVSLDGLEAQLPIAPKGTASSPLDDIAASSGAVRKH